MSKEWKVVNGRLLRNAFAAKHERSVSARFDEAGHGILPRLDGKKRSPQMQRALDMKSGVPQEQVVAMAWSFHHDESLSHDWPVIQTRVY